MKLLKRFRGASAEAPASPRPDDEGFFSTAFQDPPDEDAQLVPWATRAAEVLAQPFDREQGASLFAKLWAENRHVADLHPNELQGLSRYLAFFSVPPGKEVISQDEQSDYMAIVLEGTLSVDRVQPRGERTRLAEARPGDMLGEMSLLDAGSRFSSCATLTRCACATSVRDSVHFYRDRDHAQGSLRL